jgi:MFS transporter, DHA3 family, macrolide efflux protein
VFALFKDASGPAFGRFWLGQAFSLLGSAVTTFALGFWFYQQTGQATPIYLTALSHFLPRVLLGVPAGVIADRLNPKMLMIASDLAQAAITAVMFSLLLGGRLEPIIVYLLIALKSSVGVFEEAAEPLIISRLMPQHLIGQAFGLGNAQFGSASLLGPVLGGVLVATWGLPGVLAADMASFAFGALMTATLNLKPKEADSSESDPNEAGRPRGMIADAKEGFGWLRNQPGLIGLMISFGMFNFMLTFTSRLVTPLVLSRTGQDVTALGFVAAAFGLGNLLGGLLLGATGSPKRKVATVLIGMALAGFFEQVVMGFGRSPWVWMLANFAGGFLLPYYESANFELYQGKTPAALLGRVLSAKSLVARAMVPLSFGAAGVFADRLFEPAMNGPLGLQVQPFLGEGPGRGYALMMLIFGTLTVLVSLSGFLRPPLVILEQTPDANQPEPTEATTGDPEAVLDPFRTLEFVWEYQDPSAEDFDPNGMGATLPRET